MEASKQERCLVCHAVDVAELPLINLTTPFAHNEDFEIARRAGGSSTNKTLNEQVAVIFLLRRVLRINKDFLESTLQSTGSNPSLWDLKLCRVCYRTYEEADFVFGRLRKLRVEFEGLCKVLFRKLFESVKHDKNVIKGEGEVSTSRRRGPGRPKRARRGKSSRDLEECLSVSDKIRKEIFTQSGQGLSIPLDSEELTLDNESSFNVSTLESSLSPSLKSAIKTESSRNRDQRVNFSGECKASIETGDNRNDKQTRLADEEDELERDLPDQEDVEGNHSDMDDNAADLDYNDEYEGGVDDEQSPVDSDSDFEPEVVRSVRSTRKRGPTPRQRKRTDKTGDMGVILKAVKMENAATYTCPKCQEIFENASLCDQHILHQHYGGKWPKNFSCHICEDVSFKGEYWVRHHYRMRHPGMKWTVDGIIERSIDEGTISELTYEVIPVGQTKSFLENCDKDVQLDEVSEDTSLLNRTVNEPPQNGFSIPVVQAGGGIRHLVLPTAIKRLPEVFALIQVGTEEKACSRCDKRFPTEMQLKAHVRRAHEGETMVYECPLCPKKFERIGKVLIHVQRTHIFSKNACEICGNHFKEEILLKAHVHRVHFGIEYPYKCLKCSMRYPRRAMLNKHLKKVHKLQIASYNLLVKPKKKIPAQMRRRYKKRVKLEKKFPCDICTANGQLEMKFVSEEELDSHVKRRHMGIARPYPCPICEKRYSTQSKVEKHMNVHTVRSDLHIDDVAAEKVPPLPFVCHPCNKQFRTRSLYNVHLKGRNHQDVRPFVCELCSQGFTGLKYLHNHQSQKHHNELNIDPFKCKFCHKVLSSTRTLNDHIKLRHTKDANFSCPYCDVQFQHKSNRDSHINALHTKTQQFLCPQCPKTFLRDFYLKNHIQRVHSGKKPYECQFCSKLFSDKPTYNRHVEAHSDVAHSCPHCGKSGFKTRHALRVHRRVNHKEELDEIERKKKLAALAPIPQTSDDSNSIPLGSETNTADGHMDGNDVNKMEAESQESLSSYQLNASNCSTDSTLNLFL